MKTIRIGITLLLMTCLFADYNSLSGGVTVDQNGSHFRLRAPDAVQVELILFQHHTDLEGEVYQMVNNSRGLFELTIHQNLTGQYYGYRVANRDPNTQEFPPETIIADPYSRAVATQNIYNPINKTLIYNDTFDWGDDRWLGINPRDLVIYEAHVKDMVAHPSAGSDQVGVYRRFIDLKQQGGITHLLDMGYNAVEFLPLHDFANVEVPYMDENAPVYNTWNPYEANHWGYMTTFFFSPESQYASDGSGTPGDFNGHTGRQVAEFKEMVKTLHANGIAVIMDVVYNHVSQYGYQPLKQIQKQKYFRQNENGSYSSVSGCGNDLATEQEDMRRLIIESVLFWMREYHMDGFRFDLGLLIDWETIESIRREAQRLNPDVFITCEPWGGGYNPNGFSDRGWSTWNDQFRNGIKGQNAHTDPGFIFGHWQGEQSPEAYQRFFAGSPRELGGQYLDAAHSVNYLEAHDNHTLGDFVRLAIGKNTSDDIITKLDRHARLTKREMAIHKLAAMALLVSQGPVMIAEGQDWGRSKVIAPTSAADPDVGKIDHNSYAKDNETNWLNWKHKNINYKLVDYYRDLIKLRREYPALRHTEPEDITFLKHDNDLSIAFHLHPPGMTEILVLLNGSADSAAVFHLPEGKWKLMADGKSVKSPQTRVRRKSIKLPPTSGKLLRKDS